MDGWLVAMWNRRTVAEIILLIARLIDLKQGRLRSPLFFCAGIGRMMNVRERG